MGMQTDVKSYHTPTATPGVAFAGRTRLKGAVATNTSSSTAIATFICNNVSISGTYSITSTTVTVTTSVAHGLTTGARVFLYYTSGGATSIAVSITVTGATTFTAVTTSSGTGNVSVYIQVILEVDCTNNTPCVVMVPGEGIVANDGIFCGVTTGGAVTVFYG
jgi:hypothetical protein